MVIYPTPYAAGWLWAVVKPFVGRHLAEKVVLLPGPAGSNSPCPSGLFEYLDLRSQPVHMQKVINASGTHLEEVGGSNGVATRGD